MELLVFHLPYNRAGLEVIKKYYSIFDKLIPAWLGAAADGSIRIHDDAGTIHQYMNKKDYTYGTEPGTIQPGQ